MKKILVGLLFACTGSMVFISCSKEEPANEKVYYGNVTGELKGLPGTPGMDVYIDHKKVTTIASGASFGPLRVSAGEQVVLEFKKENTDLLLMDTSFTVAKNETAGFTVTYSEELDIKGFLQSRAVAPDSLSIQFINKLGELYSPTGGVDLYITKFDLVTGETTDTVAIVPNFEKGLLMPVLTLATDDPNNPGFAYTGMLKDRQTGEFIFNPGLGMNLFVIVFDSYSYAGRYNVGVIYDDMSGINTNLITL